MIAKQTNPNKHRSPGITAMYNELKASRNLKVLDLGSTSALSFDFFSRLSCKIHFENLDEFFQEPCYQDLAGQALIESLEAFLTEFSSDIYFDIVLTWDLFNYLDLTAIEWLASRLSAHCNPNTLLHAVRCVSPSIPATPRHFQILNQYYLQIDEPPAVPNKKHSCHRTAMLLRHMPNFHMENSYLNFSGMIPGLAEQLMRYQPESSKRIRRQASDELAKGSNYIPKQKNQQGVLHKSYALPALFSRYQGQKNLNVLDLGLKNRNNYDFLYATTKGVFAENIYANIQLQLKSSQTPEIKVHTLNFPDETRFDAILVWDILNFLQPELISALFQHLDRHTHSKTMLYAIIYSGKEIPREPQQFEFRSESDIEVFPSSKVLGVSPLNSSRLLNALRTFTLEDTFVFRPGMQRGIYEYLFSCKPKK